jgi:hypothetical protein
MEKNKKTLEATCCKPFENMVLEFQWYSVAEDNGQIFYVMPCIVSNGASWRVNFCPSCGENVRYIRIEAQDFLSIC